MSKSSRALLLSTRGLENIRKREEINDFEFIVGESRYRCPWFIAEFLSPRVARLRCVDDTICEYSVETKDDEGNFGNFVLLGHGASVKIDSDKFDFYANLSNELENQELLGVVIDESCNELTIESALVQLSLRHRFGRDFSSVVSFLASHFHEITESQLRSIDEDSLRHVLLSSELRIQTEEWLYNLIWKLVERDQSYFSLFEFVEFEFVSVTVAVQFIDACRDFFDLFNVSMLRSLGRRLSICDQPPKSWGPRSIIHGKRFFPLGGSSLDGIISYLTTKCGGNVHDQGVIVASELSVYGSKYFAKNAADLGNKGTFSMTNGEANSWICYDFKNMRVTPTHYTIVSYPYRPNEGNHPKSWCLEVSIDGKSWTKVHECSDNNDLNGYNQITTYSVTKLMRCRLIRLRQTGENHWGRHYLALSCWEIFGGLDEASDEK
jgi:hypothetical protein